MRYLISIAIVVIFVLVSVFYYHYSTLPDKNGINILLITLDTTQAKSLGVFGYDKNVSPNIDKLAREGFEFDNAFVMSNTTVPSHASILSSRSVSDHGALNNNGTKINPNIILLPEILSTRGYRTFASVSTIFLNPDNCGLDRGFEVFSVYNDPKYKKVLDKIGVRGSGITNSFIGWFNDEKPQKFFAWLHYYDPHVTYNPPENFNKFTDRDPFKFWNDLPYKNYKDFMSYSDDELKTGRAFYDGEILYTDFEVGRVISFLKNEGLYDNTLIIITNDHGENVDDHGPYFNHKTLFDEVIKEPLIIKFPGNFITHPTGRIDSLVGSIDISPTILDYIGQKIPDSFSGYSLLPLIYNKVNKIHDYLICEMDDNKGSAVIFPDSRYFYHQKFMAYEVIQAYIDENIEQTMSRNRHFTEEFYNIIDDPDQKKNIVSTNSSKIKLAKKILNENRQEGFLSANLEQPESDSSTNYDASKNNGLNVSTITFHKNFFYFLLNFSNKKVAKFELGKKISGNNIVVVNLAESNFEKDKQIPFNKDDFLGSQSYRDTTFKSSDDYSVKILNYNEKTIYTSKSVNVTGEDEKQYNYSFSADVYIKDPSNEVTLFSNATFQDGSEQVNSQSVSKKNIDETTKWQHIEFVNYYKKPCTTASMSIEISGKGTVWLDNPVVKTSPDLKVYTAAPWNDPELKYDILKNDAFEVYVGNNKKSFLPIAFNLSNIKSFEPQGIPSKHTISIYTDDNFLYFALDGPPDDKLFVEIGGYVLYEKDMIKRSDEGKSLTDSDIDNLKSLGYLQ
jgi:arylsulfatase A-like enzyme